MDFNTLLMRLGISPDNFVNRQAAVVPFEGGFLYEAEQDAGDRKCPRCGSCGCVKIGHYFTETDCSETENIRDVLRIRKVRLRCGSCGRTFSPKISGIERHCRVSEQVGRFIVSDFTRPLTFAQIAERYGLTKQRVIQIFDDKVRVVPRRQMPRVLCIDEIRFSEDPGQSYVCVIYDFESREIVDIIRNRQMGYLREYFGSIPLRERERTKVFISDMYDAYSTVCASYFPKAAHIVDRFHVVAQLTHAVNSLRVIAMNSVKDEAGLEPHYNFMKSNWRAFLQRSECVPPKYYTHKKTGREFRYDDLVFECVKLDERLWCGYLVLQDLLHFSYHSTFDESLEFTEFLSNKLKKSGCELLVKVGSTFHKWRYEIANAFTADSKRNRYSNGVAECLNNQLKTIIKSAYGYHNFERFRKRAMLIVTYGKKRQ